MWAKVWPYVGKLAIYDRLDSVFGVDGWEDLYIDVEGGMICELRVKIGEAWLTKSGAAAEKEQSSADQVKSSATAALKGAALKLGVGRYLFDLPAQWACVYEDPKQGRYRGKVKKNGREISFSWDPPEVLKGPGPDRQVVRTATDENFRNIDELIEKRRNEREMESGGKKIESEVFKILEHSVFNEYDRTTAMRVMAEKMDTPKKLERYKETWERELSKRNGGQVHVG